MHGFEGWRIKINGVIFPSKYIHAGSYKITPDQETDIDDYTDNNGIFHRNVLPATATKIEFNIKPMHLSEWIKIKEILPPKRVEFQIEYWNDYEVKYQSGTAYMPDISIEPYEDYPKNENDILYNPIRIAFIEYGEMRG